MTTKQEIVENWLPRYTHRHLEDFDQYILLTNFDNYVEFFAEECHAEIIGKDANMPSSSANGITIINFGMGSPNAATVMDLLSAIRPKACLFLGKCGGIDKKNQLGDLILPIAAIRGEGTSDDYFPPVPCLQPYAIMVVIIGPEQFIRPTAEFGNTTINLRNIYYAHVPWQSIWKPLRSSVWVLLITYLPEHYSWFPTNL